MLEEIKGIGPKTIENLNSLGIKNINDLLEYFPYRYNVLVPSRVEGANPNEQILVNGIVENPIKFSFIKKNFNRLAFRLNTGTRMINVTIFNRGFMKQHLQVGSMISVLGKYNDKTNSFVASDIKLKPITTPSIEPVYHLKSDVKKQTLIKVIGDALKQNIYISNYVPDYLIEKYHFKDKNELIKYMHNPTSTNELKEAKVFFIYEELFTFMLKMNYLKKIKGVSADYNIKEFDTSKVDEFISNLPFTLTNDQVNAIECIKNDFNSNTRMNRLVLGDVGSGKTIVAFISLYMNSLSGYQGSLMAPTEILAVQHYNNMKKMFSKTGLIVELLTSSTTKPNRRSIIEKLKNNEIDVIIGTHSVLNKEVEFKKLGLVITDEQHRFGVNQRHEFQDKGSLVDVLYLSATPIPRTLALTLFGDMQITEIKAKPSNRKEVKTMLMNNSQIKDALLTMLEEIKKGHQVYVVAPLIEDENETGMKSVNELAEKIDQAFNGKIPISILHGKLKTKEKDQIMQDFKENKTKILISTTVIEVGVDVANATLMVIFNAERFGLATLHQLRGRIGRSELESKCILISDKDTPRLRILEESNDGFYISEKDFELRGSGDIFGTLQSGDMKFKVANIKTDYKILKQASDDSKEFIETKQIEKYPIQKGIIDELFYLN